MKYRQICKVCGKEFLKNRSYLKATCGEQACLEKLRLNKRNGTEDRQRMLTDTHIYYAAQDIMNGRKIGETATAFFWNENIFLEKLIEKEQKLEFELKKMGAEASDITLILQNLRCKLNKMILSGYLGADPELRVTNGDLSVCTFNVGVQRKYKDNNGEKQTDWFRITAWRKLGEICGMSLKKGNKVLVIGTMQIKSYTDKNGEKRIIHEVVAEEVEFLNAKTKTENDLVHKSDFSEAANVSLPF